MLQGSSQPKQTLSFKSRLAETPSQADSKKGRVTVKFLSVLGAGAGGQGEWGDAWYLRWSLETRLKSPASSSLLSLVSKEVSTHTRDLRPRSADLARLGNPPGCSWCLLSLEAAPAGGSTRGHAVPWDRDFRVPPIGGRWRIQQGAHTRQAWGCLFQPWMSTEPCPAPVSVVDETSDVRQVRSY